MRVAVGRLDLDDAFTDPENRNIERAAAEVVDRDRLVLLVEAARERCRCRLVDNPRTLRPAILPASFVACRCESLKYAGTVMTASVTFSPR